MANALQQASNTLWYILSGQKAADEALNREMERARRQEEQLAQDRLNQQTKAAIQSRPTTVNRTISDAQREANKKLIYERALARQAENVQPTVSNTNTQLDIPGTITTEVGVPNVGDFDFNWQLEKNKAYEALADFYNKLLDFAGGRVDTAKRMLEYTYQQGTRETVQNYEADIEAYNREAPIESRNLIASLNRRGVLGSGFGKEDQRLLQEGQAARKLAIERARENRLSRLKTERDIGVKSQEQSLAEEKFNLERQRRKESEQAAQNTYSIKANTYDQQLTKQLQAEQRRAQDVGTSFLGQLSGGSVAGASTTGSGSAQSDSAFRNFMQTTGRQGELDKATFGGTQQGADYYALKSKYGY